MAATRTGLRKLSDALRVNNSKATAPGASSIG